MNKKFSKEEINTLIEYLMEELKPLGFSKAYSPSSNYYNDYNDIIIIFVGLYAKEYCIIHNEEDEEFIVSSDRDIGGALVTIPVTELGDKNISKKIRDAIYNHYSYYIANRLLKIVVKQQGPEKVCLLLKSHLEKLKLTGVAGKALEVLEAANVRSQS